MNMRDRLKEIIGKSIRVHFEEGGRSINPGSYDTIVEVGDDCIKLKSGDVIAIKSIVEISGQIK